MENTAGLTSKIKIYGARTPMFIKAVLAAEELRLPYEIVTVDLTKGETRTVAHKARHPLGKVPVIEHDGRFIFESNTILRYMGDLALECGGPNFYPRDRGERAEVEQWVDYISMQAGRWITQTWFGRVIGPKFFDEQPDEKFLAGINESLLEDMPAVENQLANNRYLAGDNFSLADINGYILCRSYKEAGLNMSDFPKFRSWLADIAARPASQRVAAMEL